MGNFEKDSKERELLELKRQYKLPQEALNDGKCEYDRVMESNMRELSTLREKNSSLLERNTILERELQACKDDLFRMQPFSQLPDSIIAQRFELLNDSICDWIDQEISLYLDEWHPKSPESQPQLFHHNGDSTMRGFLAQYPDTGGDNIIRFMLHCFIQKKLFSGEVLLVGLRSSDSEWLRWVERGMSQLQPLREAATIQAWRSETLTSIAGTREFRSDVGKECGRLATDIFAELGLIFPIIRGRRQSLEKLYYKIIKPAVDLAVTVQCSRTSYQFEPRMSASAKFKRSTVSKIDLGCCRMIDVATGKQLKADSPVTPDRKGNIGDRIMVLAPGLFRQDSDRLVPLNPGTDLVELYKPLGRRRAATAELEDRM